MKHEIPETHIRWIVDRYHVGTRDLTILREIVRRSKKWPRAARLQACKFAIKVHRSNQNLYRMVTGRV